MSKNHLTNKDIENIIIHLRNYDNYICEKLMKEDNKQTDNLIDVHNSVDYLISTLKRK